jgi:hypothetical protein
LLYLNKRNKDAEFHDLQLLFVTANASDSVSTIP